MGDRQQQDRDRPRYYETPQPKEAELMADSWRDEVRVIHIRDGLGNIVGYEHQRTAAQKHTDEGFDVAETAAAEAAKSFGQSLEWATSIGVEIPSRIKGVVTILGQWQKHLEDERKRRG